MKIATEILRSHPHLRVEYDTDYNRCLVDEDLAIWAMEEYAKSQQPSEGEMYVKSDEPTNIRASEMITEDLNVSKSNEVRIAYYLKKLTPQQPSVEPKNTLNRDKVMEMWFSFRKETGDSMIATEKLADALCSLSLPVLSEGEMYVECGKNDGYEFWSDPGHAQPIRYFKKAPPPQQPSEDDPDADPMQNY